MSSSATSSASTASTSPPASNSTESSALYLFTFLATLLLLLAVSCAIVIRSFILRRRLRRHMEDMIAAGVMMPGALDDFPGGMGRSRRRDFGEKPKLWEVWVDEQGEMHEGCSESDFGGKGEGKWEDIMPVSATILPAQSKSILKEESDGTDRPTTLGAGSRRRAIVSRILSRRPELPTQPSPRQRYHEAAIAIESEAEAVFVDDKDRVKENELLQVSVFISMPNPNIRRTHGSDAGGTDISFKGKERGPSSEEGEGELPDVVLGIAEVNYRV